MTGTGTDASASSAGSAGTVPLIIGDDYDTGIDWRPLTSSDRSHSRQETNYGVYDVPVAQYERWEAVIDAYEAVQDEANAYIEERRSRHAHIARIQSEARRDRGTGKFITPMPWHEAARAQAQAQQEAHGGA